MRLLATNFSMRTFNPPMVRHLPNNSEKTLSGYTQENICNLNDHCNDDYNSSLE